MISRPTLFAWLRPVLYLSRNTVTLAGAVLTTSSAVTMIGFWVLEVAFEHKVHPYAGIILFLFLPAVFVLGLLLMPAGALLRRIRLHRGGVRTIAYPQLDLSDPFIRRAASWVALATSVNIVLLSMAAYRGVQHMDSVEFCGLTCHSVMAPEYAAYRESPHSRVSCTECHIGPGAPWFVRSKLSGVRQVFAVAFETHSRPIPSPVRHLRPSREICEQCHWPEKFHGEKLLVRTRYDTDEASSPLTTVLVMKIGGRTATGAVGIHGRHFDPLERIRYVATDDRRQVISRLTYRDDDGKEIEFVQEDAPPVPPGGEEVRTMDCIDCHNRPTHAFELPERAADKAIAEGRISRDLPFIKKKAVELLRAEYPDQEAARSRIGIGLAEYYRTSYPEIHRIHRGQIEAAAEQLRTIYSRNVFPQMKLTWGSHPNNIGHEDSPGCFRCHDDGHKSANGRVIRQDCDACHTILAQDEARPAVLANLGLQ